MNDANLANSSLENTSKPANSGLWQDPGFVFVLLEPSHAGNIGSAARALAVMGFGHLRVVNPRQTDFAVHPEAIAFASGATELLSAVNAFSDLDSALADCSLAIAVSAGGREFSAPPISPEVAVQRAFDEQLGLQVQLGQQNSQREFSEAHQSNGPVAKVAWVFGTERTGLSIAQAQRCQLLCSIDSNPVYGSLNLAQAVQVIAYCCRQGVMKKFDAVQQAPQRSAIAESKLPEGHRGFASLEQVEGLMQHLERSLIQIGYLDPAKPKRLMPRLRRLFARTRLEQEEIDILRGILKTINQP
jgi:tRNA/rRNA methyltransferase